MTAPKYASTAPIVQDAAEAFCPPRLISVSTGAAEALVIKQPGGYSGPWSSSEVPYMVEPLDLCASRKHEAVCFVGPARSGKTLALVDGFLAHVICHDPGDTLIVQMTQEKAREYSKTRIDRAIRYSPQIKRRMSLRMSDDNTHDKMTRAGMWIKIGWPSATQLASSDYRYVMLTDYDRMPDDVDGEGAPFPLGVKRTQTFLSRGMCMAESSPGRDYEDPHWKGETPHEAPPASGILGVYNRSDRRRWYWKCLDCGEYFEAAPGLSLFATLPPEDDLLEEVRAANLPAMAKKHAVICCPHCGSQTSQQKKHVLNDYSTARWVPDGQRITRDGDLVGEPITSSIAGYWLGGVAAVYQKWDSIILRYLQGLREYALAGSELTLKTTVNTDQAMPYLPRRLVEGSNDQAESRVEKIERYYVPDWTRFLLCAVDVQGGQKSRFVVQVHAIGIGMESAIIDRYDLTQSPRGENVRIDPASYQEDWEALTDRVINATYRIDDEKELQVFHTVIDYAGEEGVSVNAVGWRRRLHRTGMANRVTLAKGDGKQRQLVQMSTARDQRGKKMADVPLLMFSSDQFKELVASSMRRSEPGPTYMHFPSWLGQWFFDELRAEVKDKNGKWKKIRARNEALDCWCMIWAIAYVLGPADTRREFDWANPPRWANALSSNQNVVTKEQRQQQQTNVEKKVTIEREPKDQWVRPNKSWFRR